MTERSEVEHTGGYESDHGRLLGPTLVDKDLVGMMSVG